MPRSCTSRVFSSSVHRMWAPWYFLCPLLWIHEFLLGVFRKCILDVLATDCRRFRVQGLAIFKRAGLAVFNNEGPNSCSWVFEFVFWTCVGNSLSQGQGFVIFKCGLLLTTGATSFWDAGTMPRNFTLASRRKRPAVPPETEWATFPAAEFGTHWTRTKNPSNLRSHGNRYITRFKSNPD